jgi:RNA polymerase sigma factor (sigma-70 family)
MGTTDERHLCQETVRRLLEKRSWQPIGISEETLVAATLDDLRAGQYALDEASIEKCAVRHYVAAFYHACRADGAPIQAEAFQRLGERLARIALYKTNDEDWAIECAQRALKIIYEKLDTCADPRRFFSWTRTIVLNEVYQDLRWLIQHPEESLNGDSDSQAEESPAEETDGQRPVGVATEDILADIEYDVAARQLVQRVQSVLGNSRQWQVIAEFYLNGHSYSEIAELLQIELGNVYVIMHRAIHKLRRDSQLNRDLREFFKDDARV